MDLRQALARLFVVGFEGPVINKELEHLLDRGVGGVILFERNVQSPEQVADLCARIKRRAGREILLCIDHEGGRIVRLRQGFTRVPPMREIGQTADEGLARDVGRVFGSELRAVNVDVNFAPVVDVDSNPANPIIGQRSFGRSPDLVGRMGAAFIKGMQSAGVAACAKHFPGHGDTAQDSHVDLPRLPHSMDRLEQVELPPFEAAVRAGVASIMTAHVIFEPLDKTYPATMSRPALDGILRDRMRFDGVVFSDDLEMKAIADHFGLEESIVRGMGAGVDMFLVCHTPEVQNRAVDLLESTVGRSVVSSARVEEAMRRVNAMTRRYARPPVERAEFGLLNSPEYQMIVRRISSGGSRA